jgi:hypothetical protein
MNTRAYLKAPENSDAKIWRYMDFTKFADLLQRSALWFTRLDGFPDKHEGLLPNSVLGALSMLSVENPNYGKFNYEEWRKRGCVNCWHMNENESAAMWDLYSKDAGIAVCSRISRLRSALPEDYDPGPWGIYGDAVRYVDFGNYEATLLNVQTSKPVITASELHLKRLSFSHEREYRLTSTLEGAEEGRPGKHVPICLKTLIEEVRVSPLAQDWIVDVVRNEVGVHQFAFPVSKSSLYDPVVI